MKSIAVQILSLLLGMVLLAPAALAHEDEDHEWEDDDRRLEVEDDDSGFELRSERGEDAERDRIRLHLDASDIRFEFKLEEGDDHSEAEAELEVELARILEFVDENGDGAFQESDDVREEYHHGDLSLVNITTANVSSGGVDGIEVSARYVFVDFPGSFLVFRVTAFGNLTTFQGLTQRPVELKLDIVFEAFPYTESDTLPAIELEVKTEAPDETNISGDQVAFTAGNITAVFAWLRTATVDGVDRRVGVTIGPPEIEAEDGEVEVKHSVVFAYARGDNIVHDPTFAFVRSVPEIVATVLGSVLFFAVGVLAAVAVFGSLAFARKRKRKD